MKLDSRKRFSLFFIFFFVCAFVFFASYSGFYELVVFLFFALVIFLEAIRILSPFDHFIAFNSLSTRIDEEPFHKHGDLAKVVGKINSVNAQLELYKEALQRKNQEEQLILEHLDDGILLVNADLLVTQYNRQIAKILKIDRKELLGKNLSNIKNMQKLSNLCEKLLINCLEKGLIESALFQFENASKTHLGLLALPLPQAEGVILLIKDNSPHFKMREMGKEFIANASHELRTPITIIKGFAETLRDLPEISGAMLEDIMEKVLRNCERMDVLVKNLLLLADLDYLPSARLLCCDPGELVESSSARILSIYPEVEIQIEKKIRDSRKILADPDLMELAISNLLQNAVKYSKNPVKILIKIEEKKHQVSLSIIDNGIGIPKNEIEHIFDRFYTVDKAHSRKLGGAGLGLSIVKNIIDKHDGKIQVSSKIGLGTTFEIIIPKQLQ